MCSASAHTRTAGGPSDPVDLALEILRHIEPPLGAAKLAPNRRNAEHLAALIASGESAAHVEAVLRDAPAIVDARLQEARWYRASSFKPGERWEHWAAAHAELEVRRRDVAVAGGGTSVRPHVDWALALLHSLEAPTGAAALAATRRNAERLASIVLIPGESQAHVEAVLRAAPAIVDAGIRPAHWYEPAAFAPGERWERWCSAHAAWLATMQTQREAQRVAPEAPQPVVLSGDLAAQLARLAGGGA